MITGEGNLPGDSTDRIGIGGLEHMAVKCDSPGWLTALYAGLPDSWKQRPP